MLIKTIKNGLESEWFELTKKYHRALLKDAPEAVVFLIDDLYPNSPDSGTYVTLDFPRFTVLARDFVLEENRQLKGIDRNHDKRPLEEIPIRDLMSQISTLEDEYLHLELLEMLEHAKNRLTPVQRRRMELYIGEGLSLHEIAIREDVNKNAIDCSIRLAKEKLKKFFM